MWGGLCRAGRGQHKPQPARVCRCWAKNSRGSCPGTAGVTPLVALQGLGAPAGAVLAGSGQLVAEAWRVRKLPGGACGRRGCWRPPPSSGCSTPRGRCTGSTSTPGALRKVPQGPVGAGMSEHTWHCPAALPNCWLGHHPCTATLGLQPGEDAAGILTWLQCQDHAMTVPVLCSVTLVPHGGTKGSPSSRTWGR